MPIQEKKLIRLSLIILFLSLLMVYLLLYQVKGKNMGQSLTSETSSGIVITAGSGDETTVIQTETMTAANATGYDIALDTLGHTGTVPQAKTGTFLQTVTSLSGIHMLSGTKLFYGKIPSIDKLGIRYQYALVDSTGTFFINLGMQTYDFDSITRALGGNVYKISTEQELAKNKLFGSKVLYINLPEYKDKTVLMLEYIGKEVWLIQIDYKIYHASKGYLKSLFTD